MFFWQEKQNNKNHSILFFQNLQFLSFFRVSMYSSIFFPIRASFSIQSSIWDQGHEAFHKTSAPPIGFVPVTGGWPVFESFPCGVQERLPCLMSANDKEAMLNTARYARRIRKRLGLTQAEFSLRIGVSVDTIRNWEQGKRCPTGAARSLLKVLDKAPEVSFAALD